MTTPNPVEASQPDDTAPTRLPSQTELGFRAIGPYRLVQKIGEGGMGDVWLAEQTQPVRRRVALKVIKAGMDTAQVVARFEAERQALAVMDHPNIAKVFDGGSTPEGRPYFVMEYVRGEAITEYCDRVNMSLRERLELFSALCDGVQHAHQKGIIHRDLKPSNVLVSESDGRAVPRIIDFGIAKATSQRLGDMPMHTEIGTFIGTPEYMSPEQADMVLDVDTRSDVYSLGVILYQLLTGMLPFDSAALRSGTADDMRRTIREKEPSRPSACIGTPPTTTSVDIALRRRMPPAKLAAALRGDLDWIILKAIEKDRSRRYPTANALSLDVIRYLRDEPVAAARPSVTYRVQKFVRRNRAVVGAGALVAITLSGGIATTSWQASLAQAERDAARREAANSQAVTDFVVDSLRAHDPHSDGRQDLTVARAMDHATAGLAAGKLKDQPETAAILQRTIASILNENGKTTEAIAIAEQSLALERTVHAGDAAHVADSLDILGGVYTSAGQALRSEPLLVASVAMRKRLSLGDTAAQVNALQRLADARVVQSKFAEAWTVSEEALNLARRVFPAGDHRVARSLNLGAVIRRYMGDLEQAEALYLEALLLHRQLATGDHPDVATVMSNLGAVRRRLGRLDQAEATLGEALAMNRRLFKGDHFSVAIGLMMLGQNQQGLAKLNESEALLGESLAMLHRLYPDDHPARVSALSALAGVRFDQGRLADAERMSLASMAMGTRLFKGDHAEVIPNLHRLARINAALGKWPDAVDHARQASAMSGRLYPQGEPARKSADDFLTTIQSQAARTRK